MKKFSSLEWFWAILIAITLFNTFLGEQFASTAFVSVLVAVILAFDAKWSAKVWGVMLGLSIMFVLNIFRISGLLWIDVHFTDLFDLYHHTILPLGLWIVAVTYFFLWGSAVASK